MDTLFLLLFKEEFVVTQMEDTQKQRTNSTESRRSMQTQTFLRREQPVPLRTILPLRFETIKNALYISISAIIIPWQTIYL